MWQLIITLVNLAWKTCTFAILEHPCRSKCLPEENKLKINEAALFIQRTK